MRREMTAEELEEYDRLHDYSADHILPAYDKSEVRAERRERLVKSVKPHLDANLPAPLSTVIAMHYAGMTTTEIDRACNQKPGTARAAIAAHWYDEKVSAKKVRR